MKLSKPKLVAIILNLHIKWRGQILLEELDYIIISFFPIHLCKQTFGVTTFLGLSSSNQYIFQGSIIFAVIFKYTFTWIKNCKKN